MTSNSNGGDTEDYLLGGEFALRQVPGLASVSHNPVHGPEAAPTLHRVVVLSNFIRLLPERQGFKHHFHVVIVRIHLSEMAAGKPDGANALPAPPLELQRALKQISPFLLRAGYDRQSDVLLSLEM